MNIPILILAAGQSARLGRPKQLVTIDDIPLLRRTVDVCVQSGLGDVFVVVGAYRDEVSASIKDCSCTIIENDNWHMGIGVSIAKGVSYLDREGVDGVCIVLADQVFLNGEILFQIYEKAKDFGPKIILSKYAEASGPPSFFPRQLFGDLMMLDDDSGAKRVVKKYAGRVCTIDFPKGEIDVDTREDVERIKRIHEEKEEDR